MTTFHVNPRTGKTNGCSAKPGNCPFGGDDVHYASREAARAAFEADQETFFRASNGFKRRWSFIKSVSPELQKQLTQEVAAAESLVRKVETGELETFYAFAGNLVDPPLSGFEEGEVILADDRRYLHVSLLNEDCACKVGSHQPPCIHYKLGVLKNHPQFHLWDNGIEKDSYGLGPRDVGARLVITDSSLVPKHLEQQETMTRYTAAAVAITHIAENGAPPWSVRDGAVKVVGKYMTHGPGLEESIRNLNEQLASREPIDAVRSKVRKLEPVTTEELEALRPHFSAHEYAKFLKINDEIEKRAALAKDYQELSESLTEASKLPDGVLKQRLIGPRPPRIEEEVRRQANGKMKRIKKEIPRKSMLEDLTATAKRHLASHKSWGDLKQVSDILSQARGDLKKVERAVEAREASLRVIREDAWKAGWSGDPNAIPPIPKEFRCPSIT